MSVLITPSVSTLEDRAYLAGKRTEIRALAQSVTDSTACSFDLFNCCWPIPAFADQDDPTDYDKNDSFFHIFERNPTQTATITITNNTTGESQVMTDDTFGEFFDFGTWSLRPDVSGFEIKWVNVANEMTFGNYTVKVEIFNPGPTLYRTDLNLCFELMPFSCDAAHGTVRIETNQTGYIHNGFDYRFISYQFSTGGFNVSLAGWKQQIRWYGILYPDQPDEESDFIQMSNRFSTQIQQKITNKYKLELHRLRSDFGDHLLNDNFLATQVFISDYNLNNYDVYRKKYLRKVSTDEVRVNRMDSGVNVTLTFKSVDEGTVKRVFG